MKSATAFVAMLFTVATAAGCVQQDRIADICDPRILAGTACPGDDSGS